MPTSKVFAVLWLTALTLSPVGFADTIISTGSAAFQPMVGPTAVGPSPRIADPNQAPKPYWDHQSIDATRPSAGCNIGWVVTGGSLAGCSNITGPIRFTRDDPVPNAYWAQSNGNYDPVFLLHTAAADDTELELIVTSLPSDEIGWFTLSSAGPVRHALYGSGDVPEKFGIEIPANTEFGFYLSNGTNTFYTDSALNTADAGIQHFALFRNSPPSGTDVTNYYIGAEDGPANTDFDYQDMIIHVAPCRPLVVAGVVVAACGGGGGGGSGRRAGFEGDTAVPEPGPLSLTTLAIVALALRGIVGRSRA